MSLSERDWQLIRTRRREIAAAEEAERLERERPLREAETALHKSATELAQLQRGQVATGNDPEVFISPAVAGKGMSFDAARKFNGEEARKFRENTPDFYPSPANIEAITDYLTRNSIQIADEATYRAAFERLRSFGLIEERPVPEPVVEVQPEPEPITPQPEVFEGWNPETGEPRTYTKREVERMSSDEYKRAFKITKDRQILARCPWGN